MTMFKQAILLFVILSFVSYGNCIKCWDCRSENDPKCGEPFDNSTLPLTDCAREKNAPSMCRKIKQKVNGEWFYIRDCAEQDEVGVQGDERLCVAKTGTDNIVIESCTCNGKDGCNSSTMTSPLSFCMISLAAFISVLKQCNF